MKKEKYHQYEHLKITKPIREDGVIPGMSARIFNATGDEKTLMLNDGTWWLDSPYKAIIALTISLEDHPILGTLESQSPIIVGLPKEQEDVFYLVSLDILTANKLSKNPRKDLLALAINSPECLRDQWVDGNPVISVPHFQV